MRTRWIMILACLFLCLGCSKSEEERAAEAGQAFVKGMAEESERIANEMRKEKRIAELKIRMHKFQLALEDFSLSADGKYPTDFENIGYADLSIGSEPYDPTKIVVFGQSIIDIVPWIRLNKEDPPIWSTSLKNRVIWVPVGRIVSKHKEYLPDTLAKGYKIYGAGPDSLLTLVLES